MEKRVEIVNRTSKAVTTAIAGDGEARVAVPQDSDITIVAPRDSVASMLREGDDLILTFADGSRIRLDGYFACPADERGDLTIEDPANGASFLVDMGGATCFAAQDVTSEPVTYTLTPIEGASAAAGSSGGLSGGALAALGVAVLGGGIAAAAGGGGGNDDDRPAPPPADTTPPAAPVVAPSNGTRVSGTAEAGSTVRVDVNGDGSVEGTVTADASGNWSYTPAAPLATGVTVSVIAADAAGNASQPTRIVVDATPPNTPTIYASTGVSLTGTAEAGSTVLIDLNRDGTPDATVIAGPDGGWAYMPPTPLGDGTVVTVTARDAAGNTSAPATLTLDLAAPASPVVLAATDNVDPVQGELANGAATNDTTPTFTGTAEPGSTVAVFDNGAQIGTAAVDAAGAWTFTPAPPLGEGPHSVTFAATDAAGNTGAPTAPFTLTVDTRGPDAPVLAPSNGTTVSGTAEPGATIGIDTDGDGVPDTGTTAAADGSWSVDLPIPLGDDTIVTVIATDAAGNVSAPSALTVDIGADTTPPAAPILSTVIDDAAPVQGPLAGGSATNDATPTFTGTTEPGSTVTVFDNGAPIGTATVDAAGAWTFTPAPPLGEGPHSVTFVATDTSGNVGPASSAFDFTVDTLVPTAPTVAASNGTGLAGTGEPGSTIVIDLNGDTVGDGTAQVDGAGSWTFTPASPIADGTTVSVVATDAAGNASAPVTVVVDASVPLAPAITSAADDVAGGVGIVASGGISNDPTLLLAGSAEANATVNVYDGTTLLGTVTADARGAWTLTTPSLDAGSHSFTATATDAAGNVGAASPAYDVTIDLTAPLAPTLNASDGVTLTGTAEAGATVLVDTNGDGTPDATTAAATNGSWSVTFAPALADDTVVSVTAVDAAGNTSAAATVTVDVTIDTTPPPVPLLTLVTDDAAPVQGPLANGSATNDGTPTLSGTAEANVIVSVYDNGTFLGSTTVDGAGAWSFTPATPLGDGPHSFTATTTDSVGNESLPSAAFALTVDTAVPATPVVNASNGTTLAGTAEPGSTVNLDLNNDGTVDATVPADAATGE